MQRADSSGGEAPLAPARRGRAALEGEQILNDAAIAEALRDEEEEEEERRRQRRMGSGERLMAEEAREAQRRAEAWWNGEDGRDALARPPRGAGIRDACAGLLNSSMEIARRVSDAGIKGVHAVTPMQRLPFAVLRGDPPACSPARAGNGPDGDARRRLTSLLATYGLTELSVAGDGNCQYRSLAALIYGREAEHDVVREVVVAQLARDPLRYRDFVLDAGWTDYVAQVAAEGTWGDHITLQAAADAYGLQINLLTSFESEPMIEVRPLEQKSTRVVWLSFWAEVHYNAVAVPDAPPP